MNVLALENGPSARRHSTLHCGLLAVLVLAVVPGGLISPLSGQQELVAGPKPENRFQAHLRSGEFSVARDLAQSQADLSARDAMLARLAEAQRTGGAPLDAFENAGQISDDQQRFDTLARISSFGFGGPGTQDGFGGSGFEGPPSGEAPRFPAGGITAADFDELIELIEDTIDPDSWEANGGTGRMRAYPSGVYVDPQGVLRQLEIDARLDSSALTAADVADNLALTRETTFRLVSLTRLERALQVLSARGERPTPEMMTLGGIYRLTHVLVYPDTRDVVIGGPAGPWHYDSQGRAIHTASGAPTLNLDDLVVCFRNATREKGRFWCSIDPVPANLAEAKKVVARKGLSPEDLKNLLVKTLGQQTITVSGIDAGSHAGRVIVEADYHMKLVAMGIVPSIPGVPDYFGRVAVNDDGTPPQTDALVRWWFAMNYDSVRSNPDRTVFQLAGQGVKLMSESEFWTQAGEREHTGTSSPQASGFAQDFTARYDEMARQYPLYGELRNVFDCALAASLIVQQGVDRDIDWQLNHFCGTGEDTSLVYQPAVENVPRFVDSVAGQRVLSQLVLNRKIEHTITSVSGGVEFDASSLASRGELVIDESESLSATVSASAPDSDQSLTDWAWDSR